MNMKDSEKEPNFTAMLQEQQHILYELLDTQKKMQKKQEEFEVKLHHLAQRSEASSSSSSPDNRKKCRITRDLTVSCYIHNYTHNLCRLRTVDT